LGAGETLFKISAVAAGFVGVYIPCLILGRESRGAASLVLVAWGVWLQRMLVQMFPPLLDDLGTEPSVSIFEFLFLPILSGAMGAVVWIFWRTGRSFARCVAP